MLSGVSAPYLNNTAEICGVSHGNRRDIKGLPSESEFGSSVINSCCPLGEVGDRVCVCVCVEDLMLTLKKIN